MSFRECEDVVNIDSENDIRAVLVKDEYGFICVRLFKADFNESLFEVVGP